MHPAKKELQIYAIIMNDMMEKERFSPGIQFAMLLAFTGFFWILGGIISIFIASQIMHISLQQLLLDPMAIEKNAQAAMAMQIIGTLFMFPLPVIILAFVTSKKPFKYLGYSTVLNGKQLFYAILIFLAAMWVSESLGLINQLIPLPKSTETYFKQKEDEYAQATYALVTLNTFKDYLFSIFIIALLPAVFEEMLFRAGLQNILIKWTKLPFISILITSTLFSLVHASYYGFLPRLFLGVVLGYLFYYSKNIWLSTLVHFLNNAVTITVAYIWVSGGKNIKDALNDTGFTNKMAVYNTLFAGFLLAAAMYFVFKAYKRESEQVLAKHTPVIVQQNDDTIFDNNTI